MLDLLIVKTKLDAIHVILCVSAPERFTVAPLSQVPVILSEVFEVLLRLTGSVITTGLGGELLGGVVGFVELSVDGATPAVFPQPSANNNEHAKIRMFKKI